MDEIKCGVSKMNPEPCPKIGRTRGFSYAEYLTLTILLAIFFIFDII